MSGDLFSPLPSPDANPGDDAALAAALRALGWQQVPLKTRSGRPAHCWRDPGGKTYTDQEARRWLEGRRKEGTD